MIFVLGVVVSLEEIKISQSVLDKSIRFLPVSAELIDALIIYGQVAILCASIYY